MSYGDVEVGTLNIAVYIRSRFQDGASIHRLGYRYSAKLRFPNLPAESMFKFPINLMNVPTFEFGADANGSGPEVRVSLNAF